MLFIAEYRSVRGHNKLWTPSLGGSLGCFQFLPVTNNAATHILGQDFQWIHVFISDGYICKVPASFFSTVLVTVQRTIYLTWFTICLCPQNISRDLCVSVCFATFSVPGTKSRTWWMLMDVGWMNQRTNGCPLQIPTPPRVAGNRLGREPSVGHLCHEEREQSLLHLSKPSLTTGAPRDSATLRFLSGQEHFTNTV